MRKPGDNPEPVTHKPTAGSSRWIPTEDREPKQLKKAIRSKNNYSHETGRQTLPRSGLISIHPIPCKEKAPEKTTTRGTYARYN